MQVTRNHGETQRGIQRLLALGKLPTSEAPATEIEKFQEVIESIRPPLTAEEAEKLSLCFGEDECFGLAWTLVHLIETADEYKPHVPGEGANPWRETLWKRWKRRSGK